MGLFLMEKKLCPEILGNISLKQIATDEWSLPHSKALCLIASDQDPHNKVAFHTSNYIWFEIVAVVLVNASRYFF